MDQAAADRLCAAFARALEDDPWEQLREAFVRAAAEPVEFGDLQRAWEDFQRPRRGQHPDGRVFSEEDEQAVWRRVREAGPGYWGPAELAAVYRPRAPSLGIW